MEEKGELRKSEGEILFPGIELYGMTVMPWSHDRFVAVIPVLLRMWKRMQAEGLTLDDLSRITDPGESFELLERLLPLIPVKEIVSKTLDVPLSEVEGWPFDRTDSLFLAVFMQNGQRILGLLKNLSGLAGTIRGILAKA